MDPGAEESQIGGSPLLQQFLLTENTATVQTQQSQPEPQQPLQTSVQEIRTIWQGILEWCEKQQGLPEGQKTPQQVPCHVNANVVNGETEVKGDVWPEKLTMNLIPKGILDTLSPGFIRDVKRVLFMFQPCEALQSLTKVMDNGFAGCVHFTGTDMNPNCTHLILVYSKVENEYTGFIPNDQAGFVDRLRNIIHEQHPSMPANSPVPSQSPQNQPQPNSSTERPTIWQGILVWHEKPKGPPEGQKILRQVPCYVTSSLVNGEAEVNGDGWPPKLIMQLVPEEIIGKLGRRYFEEAKTIAFMPHPCEALQSLTSIMGNEFVAFVHFPGTNMNPNCTIKVLILFYSKEQNVYLGFIPNDQPGFVDRIRELVRLQKSEQASMRQGQAPNVVPSLNPGSGMP